MKNLYNLVHLTLLNSQWRTSIKNINMNCQHDIQTSLRHVSKCILLGRALPSWDTPQTASCLAASNCILLDCLKLNPARLSGTLLSCFPVILLNFVLYLPLHTFHCNPKFTSSNMKPTASQMRYHYSRRIKMHTLREHLHVRLRRQRIFIANQKVELLIQL